MLIKITTKTDISAYDIVQNLFPDKNKDFVININETDIALIKEIRSDIDQKDLDKLAGSIVDTLTSEFYTRCMVGIGTIVTGIKDLARSFKDRWQWRSVRCSIPKKPLSAMTTWASPV